MVKRINAFDNGERTPSTSSPFRSSTGGNKPAPLSPKTPKVAYEPFVPATGPTASKMMPPDDWYQPNPAMPGRQPPTVATVVNRDSQMPQSRGSRQAASLASGGLSWPEKAALLNSSPATVYAVALADLAYQGALALGEPGIAKGMLLRTPVVEMGALGGGSGGADSLESRTWFDIRNGTPGKVSFYFANRYHDLLEGLKAKSLVSNFIFGSHTRLAPTLFTAGVGLYSIGNVLGFVGGSFTTLTSGLPSNVASSGPGAMVTGLSGIGSLSGAVVTLGWVAVAAAIFVMLEPFIRTVRLTDSGKELAEKVREELSTLMDQADSGKGSWEILMALLILGKSSRHLESAGEIQNKGEFALSTPVRSWRDALEHLMKIQYHLESCALQ